RGINSSGVVDESFIPYSNHFNSMDAGNWWWQQIEATGSLETKDPLGLGGLRPEYGAGTATNGADINVIARGNVVVEAGAGQYSENGAMIGHGGINHTSWGAPGISTREVGNETASHADFSIAGVESGQLERR